MKYKTLKQELIDNDERDENNRRIIRMNVTDDSNFLSPLSVRGNVVISAIYIERYGIADICPTSD